ncbi:hypothetical protein G6F23_015010 [Rhizopus arrhizus]|nr:hypothetical protein G6F23_015010 [Rhizopus arrhizus]
MQRIAAPMLGGMLTAPVLSMVVIPAAFYLTEHLRGHNVIGVDVPGLGGGHLETGLALGIGAQERSATVPTLDRCVSTMTDVHA